MVTVVVRRKSTSVVLQSENLTQAKARMVVARISAHHAQNWEVEIIDPAREHRGEPCQGLKRPAIG